MLAPNGGEAKLDMPELAAAALNAGSLIAAFVTWLRLKIPMSILLSGVGPVLPDAGQNLQKH